MGRIEILTKPGSDKYHGQAMFNFSDDVFNSRNPFAATRAPYQSRLTSVDFGGPLSKKSSFSLGFEKRDIDDNAVINATFLDPTTLSTSLINQAIVTPNRRTSFSPRLDYQINSNNTLVGRYHFTKIDNLNTGIGDLALVSRAYDSGTVDHTFQITETAVLGPTMINETRLQYIRRAMDLAGDNQLPAINVLGSFQGGGAQVGLSNTIDNQWELTNTTSIARGAHAIKVGGRLRASTYNDVSPKNFGGTFTFAGTIGPVLDANNQPVPGTAPVQLQAIEQYRRTLLFTQQSLPFDQIRALGGGPSQFSIAGGDPLAAVNQVDGALFVQDDWRARPNLTLSLGLRYEAQTNVSDWSNVAPRFGFAWAPGSRGGRQGKTVVRGGFGMFYDRLDDSLTLSTIRFNGLTQQQYIVRDPLFFQNIPSLSSLQPSAQTIQTKASDLRASYMMQSAIGIERQLPKNTTFAVTFTNTRALHLLRSINLRAYDPSLGLNDYQYDSSGVLNQRQIMFNVNSRLNRRISIFSFYVLNFAKSDTDGLNTFPSNLYNWRADYGRAALDTRHRFVMGGSVGGPWNVRLAPFIIARSGAPFNITSGADLNGDTIFNDRPSLVDQSAPFELTRSAFNVTPAPGQTIIARNFGDGPGYFSVNLRLTKTWGFGGTAGTNAAQAGGGGMSGGGPRGGGGGGRGGFGGMRMGGGGGMRGMMEGGGSEKRFNLTLMVSALNLFNTTNLGTPLGSLASDRFGQSNQIAGGFGPGSEANNRRLDLGVRFTF